MGVGVAGGVSGQVVDAVSTRFGMILGVGDGRRERFGVVVDAIAAGVAGGVGGFLGRSGGVTGLDIENFVVVFGEVVGVVVEVVGEVGEVGVVVEVVGEVGEVLSPSLLKLRPEASLTTSFATGFVWCFGGGGFAVSRAFKSARFEASRLASLFLYEGFGSNPSATFSRTAFSRAVSYGVKSFGEGRFMAGGLKEEKTRRFGV